MMYDMKNFTLAEDVPHRILRRKPVNPDEFVNLEEGKMIFKASFGDEIDDKKLDDLLMKADKNGNGKIEIGELTDFLKDYRKVRNAIQQKELEKQASAKINYKDEIKENDENNPHEVIYETVYTNVSRPVRKLIIMNDRSQGGTAIKNDTIELMQHRRIKQRDGKGAGEPLDEVNKVGAGIRVNCTYFIQLIDLIGVEEPEHVESS